MSYIESYILPVPTARLEDYMAMARASAAIWLRLGALSVMEARAENAPVGTLTSFPRAVQMDDDETVVVAYVRIRDRAHRDAVITAAEADAEMMAMFSTMPVDGKRMIWGGFEVIVNESSSV